MSQVRPAEVSIDVFEYDEDATFGQRFHSAQNRFIKLTRAKSLLRHMTLILCSIAELRIMIPIDFIAVLNASVLPVVVYWVALLVFIPVNIALLPISLCSNASLAFSDACTNLAMA
ncbi:hypothetical protein AAVH_43230 [Aphelenchoides avenae]|nr:hypothetical protein AAVH_43230 [Aphelenchus avenae]